MLHFSIQGSQRTVVHPVAETNAPRDERPLNHNKLPAVMGPGRLGLPRRDRTRVNSIADTRDDPPEDELLQVVRRRHEDRADGHDGAPRHYCAAAAERVADEDADNGAEEAPEVVRRDGDALVPAARRLQCVGYALLEGVDVREVLCEGRQV